MATNVSLDELVKRGAHFGHQTKRWNPKMEEYIYSSQEGVHIFDLVKTKALLEEALSFLVTSKKAGKVILFVGTKKQVKKKLKEVAIAVNEPYISERWLGGLVTNFGQIKRSIDKLKKMKIDRDAGEFKRYTKKERLLLDREIDRLERFFGGLVNLNGIPDIIFLVDAKRESTAVREAGRHGITTVAVIDSNSDPTKIDYPIPMNDDATKALDYVLELVEKELRSVKPKKGSIEN